MPNTLFPQQLDNFQNPGANDAMDAAGLEHDVQHAKANDAIAALQVKVGVDDSADENSIDFRLRALESVELISDNVTEGSVNLYWTQGRFDTALSAKSTSDLAEGSNLYFTTSRVLNTALTGFSSLAGNVTATDTILQAFGRLASKAYVDAAVADLVASAPGTLDTLNELATALGDDPNFATTISTQIGTKLAIANNLSDLANTATARANLGLGNVENKSSATIRGEITASNVTTALGYTPYSAANPNNYISGITSSMVTTALGYTPYNAANPNNYISGITSSMVTTALGYTPVNKAGDTMTAPLAITSGTITASAPALSITQTWNNSGVTFTGMLVNVTDTASAAGSKFLDLQIAATSKFYVDKSGFIYTANGSQGVGGIGFGSSANGIYAPGTSNFYFAPGGAGAVAEARTSGLGLGTSSSLSWGTIGSTQDVLLTRDAAAVLALRNGANAQTFRIYQSYTDASNYSRINHTGSQLVWDKAGTGSFAITASAPVLDMQQEWNNAAVTFTALKLNVTNTASASGSLLMDVQKGGTSQFTIRHDGYLNGPVDSDMFNSNTVSILGYARIASALLGLGPNGSCEVLFEGANQRKLVMASGWQFGWASSTAQPPSTLRTNLDTILVRDGAANTIGMRNGANAQTFNIYNTYTDASNYERGFMRWNANVFEVGCTAAGTGATTRVLNLVTGSGGLNINGQGVFNSSARMNVVNGLNFSGVFMFSDGFASAGIKVTDGSGSTAGSGTFLGMYNLSTNSTNYERGGIKWSSNVFQVGTEAVGAGTVRVLQLNSSGLYALNGTTASFPAIKRNGAAIDFRLADDSAYAAITAGATRLAAHGKSLYVGSSGGNVFLATSASPVFGTDAYIYFFSDNSLSFTAASKAFFQAGGDGNFVFGSQARSYPNDRAGYYTDGTFRHNSQTIFTADAFLVLMYYTPVDSTETGTPGQVTHDDDYIYVWSTDGSWNTRIAKSAY